MSNIGSNKRFYRAFPKNKNQSRELISILNTSSQTNSNLLVTFLAYQFYVAVIIASTTDEMLIQNSPVTLPLLNIQMPLFGFYISAPCLLFLFHWNILLNLREHSTNLQKWHSEAREIYPFLFNFSRKSTMAYSLCAVVYYLAPLSLMVLFYLRFLPYHHAGFFYGLRTR